MQFKRLSDQFNNTFMFVFVTHEHSALVILNYAVGQMTYIVPDHVSCF